MKPGPVILILTAMTGLISMPALMFDGETLPNASCLAVTDAWARIDAVGRFFHDLKNLLTEAFRCDPQWWAKFSSFTWTIETIAIMALFVWALALLIRLRRTKA